MSVATTVLQVQGLGFGYPRHPPLWADWSARLAPGVSWVRGGDGRGKTTLLRVLAGDVPASAGRLQLHGVDLQGDAQAYRRQVFWVDPQTTVFDPMTALDYFRTLAAGYPALDLPGCLALAAELSLQPHLEKPLYMLSTGSKRKVWLAAAFASGAALTLLDTPFAALDKASAALVRELLEEAAGHGTRAWVVADTDWPAASLALAGTLDLGD